MDPAGHRHFPDAIDVVVERHRVIEAEVGVGEVVFLGRFLDLGLLLDLWLLALGGGDVDAQDHGDDDHQPQHSAVDQHAGAGYAEEAGETRPVALDRRGDNGPRGGGGRRAVVGCWWRYPGHGSFSFLGWNARYTV